VREFGQTWCQFEGSGLFAFFSSWLSILAAFRGFCIRRAAMAEVPPDAGETQDLLHRSVKRPGKGAREKSDEKERPTLLAERVNCLPADGEQALNTQDGLRAKKSGR